MSFICFILCKFPKSYSNPYITSSNKTETITVRFTNALELQSSIKIAYKFASLVQGVPQGSTLVLNSFFFFHFGSDKFIHILLSLKESASLQYA